PRAAHLIHSLSELNLNISFYPLQFPIDSWSEIYRTLPKTVEVIANKGRLGMQSFLSSRRHCFQYIMVSRVHNMAFLQEILEADSSLIAGAKLIYDAEALTAAREIMQKQFFKQFVSENEKDELISKEMQHASLADTVIAVSEKEAAIYRQHNIKNVCVLGHTMKIIAGENEFTEREGLLFVGALRDEGSPNVDSLLWFTVNVLPLIEKSIPDIKLYIAGDSSASSLASIDKVNVSFLGRVENLDDIYNSCRVFIAPTRFAAGIPHKVHEATARGIPCVITPLLADQLGWQHEQEVLVGTSPEEYAEQCIRLYQDKALWQSVRDAGLDAVAEDCSEEKFQSNLNSLFD
ncbi:MAG: glycosyltransferase family 4 protein, partial [Gammaproteobacteria bacterium]|nr:glycosyltransferase family 4 protein [Gammaproteobacteria bacterium]